MGCPLASTSLLTTTFSGLFPHLSYPTPLAAVRPARPTRRLPQALSFTPGGVLRERREGHEKD